MASIRKRQNKNGSIAYVVRAYAGKGADGKARYLSKTYTPAPHDSPRKIEQTLQSLCAELQSEARGSRTDMPAFSAYARQFLQRKSLSVGEYTLQSYRLALRKACEYLGHLPLDEIGAPQLDGMVRSMSAAKSQYGKAYASVTIRHVLTLVRGCLAMAVLDGLLEANPAERSRYCLPKAEPSDPVFLEADEARAYLRAALSERDPKIRAMVLLYLYTGMRMEELCGLEWQDIDFEKRTIFIRRASVYIPGRGPVTKRPKTRAGTRLLRADDVVFEALSAYRSAQHLSLKGLLPAEDTRLFTRRDGRPIIPGTTAIWLKRFALRNGLRAVSPHKLRHTFATLQIAHGTDIRTVAGAMGHSSPMTTLTIYSHQVREASEKAARAMSEILTP